MMDSCFLLEKDIDGGGNTLAETSIILRRVGALGDVLAATVVSDKLMEKGSDVTFQSHASTHCILRRVRSVSRIMVPGGYVHCDLDGAYETNPARKTLHFSECFIARANQALRPYGIDIGSPVNARPRLEVTREERAIAHTRFSDYPRPWVFLCPRSNSYIVRQVPDAIWEATAKNVRGTCFWLGSHPAPPGIIDLQARNFDNVILWLSVADLLISVDTGPAHVASALGTPLIVLGQSASPELHFSDQRDFETIWPEGNLDCLNCQNNICPKSRYSPPCQLFHVEKIARLANHKLDQDRVAALIPTFAADAHMLSKTIANVSPQVDEIVITVAADGRIPDGLPADPKVRIVRCPRSGIGFGKNVNFGFRHTSAQWVLLLNDDCYLNGDCVEQLKSIRATDVGMIAHLLRYPNGQIYFAGRQRRPGERGFPHINHRDYIPNISSVSEMEAVSCTSVLINRKAFYEIGGFDERFFMYAEDDDIGVRMRQAGYKLLYHPTALGVHEGSATVRKIGKQAEWIGVSTALMEKLWGPYWDWNKNRVPLGNFDYLKK